MSIERPFRDEYLAVYSGEHLHYEIDHFFWLAEKLSRGVVLGGPTPEDVQRLRNVMIEGFVIHLRNMIDFLYPTKTMPTDVVALDFFVPGAWEKLRPEISAKLFDARGRAHKEIAHLTSMRMDGNPPEKGWDFPGLADEIRPILRLFCQNALPTRVPPKVEAAIR